MRLFLGLILGCAITIGGAYVADNMSAGPGVRPMVNWDVVAKNIGSVVTLARDGWKKITGCRLAAKTKDGTRLVPSSLPASR